MVPPVDEIRPMPLLRKENSFFIDEPKAIRLPSGDQTGLLSAPSCSTSLRTLPSVTVEMSAVAPLVSAELMRWSKAIFAPSGDQLNEPTVNAPLVSRRAFFA